jgi:dephospho-CoA kinase
MYDMVKAQLEGYRKQGVGVVVLEAPLLIEANWTSLVDEVWVTVASESTVLRRLKEKFELSEPESLARIHSQLPSEEKVKHADVIINTDCALGELRAKVEELWQGLHASGV